MINDVLIKIYHNVLYFEDRIKVFAIKDNYIEIRCCAKGENFSDFKWLCYELYPVKK